MSLTASKPRSAIKYQLDMPQKDQLPVWCLAGSWTMWPTVQFDIFPKDQNIPKLTLLFPWYWVLQCLDFCSYECKHFKLHQRRQKKLTSALEHLGHSDTFISRNSHVCAQGLFWATYVPSYLLLRVNFMLCSPARSKIRVYLCYLWLMNELLALMKLEFVDILFCWL